MNNTFRQKNSSAFVKITQYVLILSMSAIFAGCGSEEKEKAIKTEVYYPPLPYQVCQPQDFQAMEDNEVRLQDLLNVSKYAEIGPFDTRFPQMARKMVLSEEIISSCKNFISCHVKSEDAERFRNGRELCGQNADYFRTYVTDMYPASLVVENYDPASYCVDKRTSLYRGSSYALESILKNGIPDILQDMKQAKSVDPIYLSDVKKLCGVYKVIDPENVCEVIDAEAISKCEELNQAENEQQ